jgi:uncharacterized membrane protein
VSSPAGRTIATGNPFLARVTGWVLTVGGLTGALAAFVLIVEKIALIRDPAYTPSCSINPLLSCGSVMSTGQAEVFGFPNPLIGVAAFPVVATFGVLALSRVPLAVWMWRGLLAGTVFGLGFVHWLMFQSIFRIQALCPYCMVVWVVMITVFWYTLLYCLSHGVIPVPARLRPAVRAAQTYHGAILAVWLLTIVVVIGVRFWDFWQTLL